MKLLLSILLTILLIPFSAYNADNYYWYKGQKVQLTKSTNKKYIVTASNVDTASFLSYLISAKIDIVKKSNVSYTSSINQFKNNYALLKSMMFILEKPGLDKSILKEREEVLYESSTYLTDSGDELAIYHCFNVKLKKASDFKKLDSIVGKYQVEIVGNNKLRPLWYTINAVYQNCALDLANAFYETGLFEISEPDFIPINSGISCVNDQFFNDQWNLENTGQHGSGSDINLCDAHQITKGSQDIIIAVIDEGIQLHHPDLINSLHPISFNADNGQQPSVVTGGHGTLCAGIIGAESNNNIGITGIAPDCRLMSISHDFNFSPISRLADAIDFAWQNGASVINCSWSIIGGTSTPIEMAINDALTQGRGGLGCIVVFSAGNQDVSPVNYPANFNHDILVVGAMSPCDERKNINFSCDGVISWGSNFGVHLDIVAPGVFIPSTDLIGFGGSNQSPSPGGDYFLSFDGTSSSAPHVAAVAGLILSIDPTLTQKQVADIIERSAQKVGNFNYTTQSGRPNGTYHQEMGYGLLDAHKALLETICPSLHFKNIVFSNNQHFISCQINIQDVDVTNSSHVIFEVSGFQNGEVNISGDFEVCVGCELEVK